MTARLVIIAATAFVIGALGAFVTLNLTGQAQGPTVANVSGKALIGGPFTMVDHTGKTVTEKDFQGRYMLVFFGFTNCPDICPTELQVMSAAMQKLGGKADKVVPVFVSVDPKRDTVERMASYVSNFDKRIVGLTGTRDQVQQMTKAFRIYYAEVKDESTTDGYSMDHSSIAYLMGPDGEYLTHFAFGTKPDAMAEGIAKYL
jgi:cytochrome oxidase Cu insertion factor (SCO1/SenC/PrrC family)